MNVFDQVSLFLVLVVPLVGAMLSMFIPKDRPRDAWYFAIFVSAICFILSIIIFTKYDYTAGGFQLTRTFQWLEEPLNISLSLG
ncbi:MAG TPA: hypothetical protein VFA32_13715, partial [Dehalococcoidia bacterium]|nr:hypothetical protein [Dehalococcoidia bacterium]